MTDLPQLSRKGWLPPLAAAAVIAAGLTLAACVAPYGPGPDYAQAGGPPPGGGYPPGPGYPEGGGYPPGGPPGYEGGGPPPAGAPAYGGPPPTYGAPGVGHHPQGGITRAQFIARAQQRAIRHGRDPNRAAMVAARKFDQIDTNHDGIIEPWEMQAWRAAHGHYGPPPGGGGSGPPPGY